MNLSAYLRGALLVTVILLGALAALKFTAVPFLPNWLFAVPPVLAGFSMGAFALLVRTERNKPSRFVSAFMGAIGGKMFLTLCIVAGYILLDGKHRLLVSLTIMGCYAVLMAHFAGVASRQLRRSGKDSEAGKSS